MVWTVNKIFKAMEQTIETRLRLFLNYTLKAEVAELMEGCFTAETDPEVSW